jgi:hypothetical protein
MPVTRRGLVAPQNTFLENIVRRCNGSRMRFLLIVYSKFKLKSNFNNTRKKYVNDIVNFSRKL